MDGRVTFPPFVVEQSGTFLRNSRRLSEAPNIRIKDLPEQERPRERLIAMGADSLKTSELIAILLRTGMKGISAMEMGEQLIRKYGTLENLARASVDDIRQIKGIGRDKAIALKSAFTLARRMADELRHESPVLDNPATIASLLREENRMYQVEHLHVLLLNTRRKLIRMELIAKGTLDTIPVHPREVFKMAISANASAIILVHNHPSGDPEPSAADIRITRDLIRAGQLLKIDVLDHIILGSRSESNHREYVSLREMGYFHS
jgi:DNA repair protein RadC